MAAPKSPQQICLEFHRNPTINPSTGRPIQPGKGVYNDLAKMCGPPPPTGRGTMVSGALPPSGIPPLGGVSGGGFVPPPALGGGFAPPPALGGGFAPPTTLPPTSLPGLGGGFALPTTSLPGLGGGFAPPSTLPPASLPALGGGFAPPPALGGGFALPSTLPPTSLPGLGGGFAPSASLPPLARQPLPGVVSMAPPAILPGFAPPVAKPAMTFPGLPALTPPITPGFSAVAPTPPITPGFPAVTPTTPGVVSSQKEAEEGSGTLLIIHSPDDLRLFIIPESDETVELIEQAHTFASGEEDPDSPDFLDFEEQIEEYSVQADGGVVEDVNITTVLKIHVP